MCACIPHTKDIYHMTHASHTTPHIHILCAILCSLEHTVQNNIHHKLLLDDESASPCRRHISQQPEQIKKLFFHNLGRIRQCDDKHNIHVVAVTTIHAHLQLIAVPWHVCFSHHVFVFIIVDFVLFVCFFSYSHGTWWAQEDYQVWSGCVMVVFNHINEWLL